MLCSTTAMVMATMLAVSGWWWIPPHIPTPFRRALVLDFDRTITTEHLWRTLYDPYYGYEDETATIPLQWSPVSRSLFKDYRYKNPYFPKPDAQDPTLILEKLASQEARDFLQYIYGNGTRLNRLHSFLGHFYNENVTLVILSHGITQEIVTTMKSVGLDVSWIRLIVANSFGPNQLTLEAWNSSLGYHSVPWKPKVEMVQDISTRHDITVYLDDDVLENNKIVSHFQTIGMSDRVFVIGPQYDSHSSPIDLSRRYTMRGIEMREMDAAISKLSM